MSRTATNPHSVTVFPWLRDNLGPRALAGLTSTDAAALRAAVEIIELYSTLHDARILAAFRVVVLEMQPKERDLAFHTIAHVLDWGARTRLWERAGLPTIENPRICKYEPAASR